MVGVEELAHYYQKGVEDCLSDWKVEEELHHLVVMEVVMEMVMIMEEVVGHLPLGEMEEMVVMVVMMEMVVEEMIHHHHLTKDSHNTVKVEEIDGCMWYKDHPDPQVNWDKMEGVVGWTNATNAQRNNKSPRSSTCSIRYYWFRIPLKMTMVDVLAMQQQTNLTLQDQIRRANDAQMEQTLAMHDLADMTE